MGGFIPPILFLKIIQKKFQKRLLLKISFIHLQTQTGKNTQKSFFKIIYYQIFNVPV